MKSTTSIGALIKVLLLNRLTLLTANNCGNWGKLQMITIKRKMNSGPSRKTATQFFSPLISLLLFFVCVCVFLFFA